MRTIDDGKVQATTAAGPRGVDVEHVWLGGRDMLLAAPTRACASGKHHPRTSIRILYQREEDKVEKVAREAQQGSMAVEEVVS